MPKNVGDLGKFIVATGFKKLPKVQKIAQSGHTEHEFSQSDVPQSLPNLLLFSVTRLGNLWDFGQLFKALGNN